jgi:hypothetical protein
MFGGQHVVAVNEIASAEDWTVVIRKPLGTASGGVTENVSLDTADVVRDVSGIKCHPCNPNGPACNWR